MEQIKISKSLFIFWLIITLIFVIVSGGVLFPLLLIPLYVLIYLKKLKYYYNKENFYIEKGVFLKNKEVIPLINIDSIESKNILGLKFINIFVKGKLKSCMHVKNPTKEVNKFMELKNK